MKDTIYRDDAVALVIKAIHGTDNKEIQNYLMDGLRKQMWSLPSAENSNTKTQNSNQETQNSNWDLIYRADAIEAVAEDLASALNVSKDETRELAEHALSALPSAEATCATCADRAMCIMSAPDGNWKACKDYRPSAEAVQGEWINVNTTNPPRFYHMGECSICGAHGQITDNFCPNCGARMTPYKGGDTE